LQHFLSKLFSPIASEGSRGLRGVGIKNPNAAIQFRGIAEDQHREAVSAVPKKIASHAKTGRGDAAPESGEEDSMQKKS
jgi:hypothetical protein